MKKKNFDQRGQQVIDQVNIAGNVYIRTEQNKNNVQVERLSLHKLKIGNFWLQAKHVVVGGLLGSIGCLVLSLRFFTSIEMYFNNSLIVLLLIFGSGMFFVVFSLGLRIQRTRFLKIKWLNFETDTHGRLYRSKIGGICPECKSPLKLRRIGPENNRSTKLICERYSRHQWNFDPTELPAIEAIS